MIVGCANGRIRRTVFAALMFKILSDDEAIRTAYPPFALGG